MQQLSFQLGTYRWRSRWVSFFVTVLGVTFLVGLGFWQLDRAEQKRLLLIQSTQRLHATPIPLRTLDKNNQPPEFTHIITTGHFDNQHVLLLDNQFYQHQAGYNVISPFIADNDTWIILVDRGWVPLMSDRNRLPTIQPINNAVTIMGNIRLLQNKGLVLGDNIEVLSKREWRIARVDASLVEKLSKTLAKPIYPFILTLPPHAPYGFAREAVLVLNMPPARHVAYAIQWFALAILASALYFLLHLQRKEL